MSLEKTKRVTLSGTPDYNPWTRVLNEFKIHTILMPENNYDTVNTLGRYHYCKSGAQEMYVHKVSEADPLLYNYTHSVQPLEECDGCKEIIEKNIEEDKIRKEAEAFKDSIEVKVEVGDYDYSWSIAQTGQSPDGRLWIRYGSGCSCNDISEENWVLFTEARQAKEATRHIGDDAVKRAKFIADSTELLSGI